MSTPPIPPPPPPEHLIPCPFCQGLINPFQTNCPHCGETLLSGGTIGDSAARTKRIILILLLIFVLVPIGIFLLLVIACFGLLLTA